jgi:hypothetical protein
MNAAEQIDQYITSIKDWRGKTLGQLRKLIHSADPALAEEWKWDVPVFTRNGMVCAISAFKEHVKINFFKGALLPDPHKLINNGFDSKAHRSIDFSQGDAIDEAAVKALVKAAVELNTKK